MVSSQATDGVRRAAPEDAGALARLRLDFRGPRAPNVETEGEFLARCAAWMRDRLGPQSSWRVWVLVRNNEVAGNVWLQAIEKLPNPTAEPELHAYISNFYVAPEYRNGGAGSALLGAVLDECRRLRADTVFLWPSARSRPLYERHGFAVSNAVLTLKLH